MYAFAVGVLIAVNILALVAGVRLAFWTSRRVPMTLSLGNANPRAVRLIMWNLRIFVFLVSFVTVTAPVVFITDAIV